MSYSDLIGFCQRWLTPHLQQHDQQFAVFLLQHTTTQECEYIVNLNRIAMPLSLRSLLTDPRLKDADHAEYDKIFVRVFGTKVVENEKNGILNVLKIKKDNKEKNDKKKIDKKNNKKFNNEKNEIEKLEKKNEEKEEKEKNKSKEQEQDKEKDQDEEKKKTKKKKGKKKPKEKKKEKHKQKK
jgi:hypothetical protein